MMSVGARELNELGERMLLSGNPGRARELLEQAVRSDAANASAWLNLAAALRGLGSRDEEMQALQRALTLEPNNLRAMLQKASL
jgi:aspartate beta-hydroxylase